MISKPKDNGGKNSTKKLFEMNLRDREREQTHREHWTYTRIHSENSVFFFNCWKKEQKNRIWLFQFSSSSIVIVLFLLFLVPDFATIVGHTFSWSPKHNNHISIFIFQFLFILLMCKICPSISYQEKDSVEKTIVQFYLSFFLVAKNHSSW